PEKEEKQRRRQFDRCRTRGLAVCDDLPRQPAGHRLADGTRPGHGEIQYARQRSLDEKGRDGMTIRVAIAGPRGKMGQEAVHTVRKQDGMELVAVLDYKEIGSTLAESGLFPEDYEIPVFLDLGELHAAVKPDVLVDLTSP